MSRLIDADALVAQWEVDAEQVEDVIAKMFIYGAIRDVKHAPTIDTEPHWIPCSEKMPEEHESIWAKAKGTDRWSEAMWEKQSDEVIVTELFEDGTTRTETACTHDGEWYVKVKIVKRRIIAWMPMPTPWKGEK